MTNEQKRIKADIDALMAAQNARIESEYQARQNKKAKNFLFGFLVIGTALVCLWLFAEHHKMQAAKEKETELNCKPINQ